eukprot:2273162-Rhodomonas_salina.1
MLESAITNERKKTASRRKGGKRGAHLSAKGLMCSCAALDEEESFLGQFKIVLGDMCTSTSFVLNLVNCDIQHRSRQY